ncbi:hypothetical protein NDU88_001408 [Pleurodeles waltl]|uniref:Uncharacterized protein n=1 Tax=Pleurodeles waltl TaxID=8319 RepID=A0AAV7LLE2_PLEWA|nr:hypothetical protein NDU88_001408 [Pleurodeles waltl]
MLLVTPARSDTAHWCRMLGRAYHAQRLLNEEAKHTLALVNEEALLALLGKRSSARHALTLVNAEAVNKR